MTDAASLRRRQLLQVQVQTFRLELLKQELARQKLKEGLERHSGSCPDDKDDVDALLKDIAVQTTGNGKAQEQVQNVLQHLKEAADWKVCKDEVNALLQDVAAQTNANENTQAQVQRVLHSLKEVRAGKEQQKGFGSSSQDPKISVDTKAQAREVASEVSEVRYSLKDPVQFAGFLRDADVKLIRWKYLVDLVVSKRPLPRRQEAELETFAWDGRTQTALVSHEEMESWAKGGTDAIICSISHAWETREHPDPCRFQLEQIASHAGLFHAAFEAEVWIFYDYVSLFQFEREPGHQQNSFGKAMENMHIMYSHECTLTFRIESLTPEDVWKSTKLNEKELIQVFDAQSRSVMTKPLQDLVENRTAYLARGWCKAEIEWSSLRTVNAQHQRIDRPDSEEVGSSALNARIPMTPAKFREQMEKAKFTHRSDADSVIRLQEKIFHEKVTVCESLVLEGLAASEVMALAEALPNYQKLKSLKIFHYECGEAESNAFGEALAVTGVETLEVLRRKGNTVDCFGFENYDDVKPKGESGGFMGKAIALGLKGSQSIRYIDLRDSCRLPDTVVYEGEFIDYFKTESKMGREVAQAIGDALKVNKSVRNINLSENDIRTEGVKAIAQGLKVNTSVQNINLEGNDLCQEAGEALAEALKVNNSVQNINLSENRIGKEGVKALAEALMVNNSVRDINLCNNDIGLEGLKAIAKALKVNTSIQNINLKGPSNINEQPIIGAEEAQALAEALEVNKSLQNINLEHYQILPEGTKALEAVKAALERNRRTKQETSEEEHAQKDGDLKQVCRRKPFEMPMRLKGRFAQLAKSTMRVRQAYFAGTGGQERLGPEEAKALAEALMVNKTICEVNLMMNAIGNQGCKALAGALKLNTTIREVSLWENGIGDEGCQAIAEALETNQTVEDINFFHNNISSEGAKVLAKTLKVNKTIRSLRLGLNPITDDGCKAIAAALETNSALEFIDLGRNPFGQEGAKALAEALKVNNTLCEIELNSEDLGEGLEALREVVKEKEKKGRTLSIRDSFHNRYWRLK